MHHGGQRFKCEQQAILDHSIFEELASKAGIHPNGGP
jgi:hypothetical protein